MNSKMTKDLNQVYNLCIHSNSMTDKLRFPFEYFIIQATSQSHVHFCYDNSLTSQIRYLRYKPLPRLKDVSFVTYKEKIKCINL